MVTITNTRYHLAGHTVADVDLCPLESRTQYQNLASDIVLITSTDTKDVANGKAIGWTYASLLVRLGRYYIREYDSADV
jgi:hypothetical protein